jgi:hypothetical protein
VWPKGYFLLPASVAILLRNQSGDKTTLVPFVSETAQKKQKTQEAEESASSADLSYPLPPFDPLRKAFAFFTWQFCSCFVIDWNLAADQLIEPNRWQTA